MTPFESALEGSLEGSRGGRTSSITNSATNPATALHHYRGLNFPRILVDELETHLKGVPAGSEQVIFTGEKGGLLRRGNWRRTVKWPAAVEVAGLPAGFHFHDLRHTGNHLAAQTGASTRELMQRMGHSTVRAALIYQHATEARSRELADRLDALVREQREVAE